MQLFISRPWIRTSVAEAGRPAAAPVGSYSRKAIRSPACSNVCSGALMARRFAGDQAVVMPRPARSHGRAALSAPSTARVESEWLSV